jgi:hypothetical protein
VAAQKMVGDTASDRVELDSLPNDVVHRVSPRCY